MHATPRVMSAIERLKNVYLEAPETTLTLHEATRYAAVEPSTCRLILDALHDVGFLYRAAEGVFCRRLPAPPA